MERRKRDALWHRKQHESVKIEIFKTLGSKCNICGFDDIRALCIDHINGGGLLERAKPKGQYYVVICKKLRDSCEDYQLLCANCNLIKKVERKEGRKRVY
jgi:hypothetical protein